MSSHSTGAASPAAVVRRLYDFTNAHDIDGIVSCFRPDYRNETPAHPDRGFAGNEQVRRNWTQILAAVTDVTATILDLVESGDRVWIETEHHGSRPDGSRHELSGVIIFDVSGGLIRAARFYLEPVTSDGVNADAAVARTLRFPPQR